MTDNAPEENDVAENVVLVSVDLVRPVRGLVRQILVDQPSAHQVAQQVTEGRPGCGTETDLKITTSKFTIVLIQVDMEGLIYFKDKNLLIYPF